MTEYWVLQCFSYDQPGDWIVDTSFRSSSVKSWSTGRVVEVPSVPIQLNWEKETVGDPRPPLFFDPIPLMSKKLFEHVSTAGVDNLQVFEAEILSDKGNPPCRDYLVFNVLGVVDAVDMSQSKFETHGGPNLICVDFDSIVIDPSKTHDLGIFRLAQTVSTIVVHERVRNYLETKFPELSFIKPEEWLA